MALCDSHLPGRISGSLLRDTHASSQALSVFRALASAGAGRNRGAALPATSQLSAASLSTDIGFTSASPSLHHTH